MKTNDRDKLQTVDLDTLGTVTGGLFGGAGLFGGGGLFNGGLRNLWQQRQGGGGGGCPGGNCGQ